MLESLQIPLRTCRTFDELTPEIMRQDIEDAIDDWFQVGAPIDQGKINSLLPLPDDE